MVLNKDDTGLAAASSEQLAGCKCAELTASLSHRSAVPACARQVYVASEPLLLILSPWAVITVQKSHRTKSLSC